LPPQGRTTDPHAHTTFDNQIVARDPLDGSRVTRRNIFPTDSNRINTSQDTIRQNVSLKVGQSESASAADETQVNTTEATPPRQNVSPSLGQAQSAAAGMGGNQGSSGKDRDSSIRDTAGSSRAGHAAFGSQREKNIFNIDWGRGKRSRH